MTESRAPGPRAVLIGPMAAGKTSVGRALARHWGVRFIDLDAAIVERAGAAVPEIFDARGEAGFRELEADVLVELLARHDGVLALGGGAPLTPGSADALAGHRVVLLEIDEDLAISRLRGGAGRPLLAGDDPIARWRDITRSRMPAYRRLATHVVTSGRGGPAAVARAVVAALETPDPVPAPEESPTP